VWGLPPPLQDGRIHIEKFLKEGGPDTALGLRMPSIGWLWKHESGT
jgi:hypothetical protein